jgi:microcystin-dependent protein
VSTPFLAEVKIISWNYPPKGWAFCNGALLPINQNQPLFSVIGTYYGGNGIQNFALPNLQGRTPVHVGGQLGSTNVGTVGGEEFHTLSQSEMPAHLHMLQGVTQAGTVEIPAGNFLAQTGSQAYHAAASLQPMAPTAIANVGASQPHENRAPFLVLNFVIALSGIYPSRN